MMCVELKRLRSAIEFHNKSVYVGTPVDEPIDLSLTKKSWGIDVIPEKFWIDLSKTYKTRNGKRVVNLQKILYNFCGDEVTFPIKGTVVLCESPRKHKSNIWTLTGHNVVAGESEWDLVES